MRPLLPALVAALAAAVLAPAAAAQPMDVAERPNIVLVFTDDQRWDTLAAMPKVRRALVDKGVSFSNAFVVNSVCCPSRASILTGGLSRSTGVYTNKGRRGYRAFREESTIATWLQAAGYRTAYVGKYLNGYRGPHVPPGWSRWFAFDRAGFFNYTLNVDGATVAYGSEPEHYSTDVLAAEAVSFIEQTRDAFFLVFAPFAPHSPATPAPRHENAFAALEPWRPPSYDEEDVSDKPEWVRSLPRLTPERQAGLDTFRGRQLRSLLAVDDGVDAIVNALRRAGRLENTLIVFTSDNGIAWGEHRHMTKMDPYEESIRIPFVVRYDRAVTAPRTEAAPVLNIDLAPTFAQLAGVFAPAVDGLSFLPLLYGPGAPWRQDFIVEHVAFNAAAFGVRLPRMPNYCALRSTGWTYVSYETGEEELYDLSGDPYQLTNLASYPGFAPLLATFRKRLSVLCNPPPPISCLLKGTAAGDILRGNAGYDVICAGAGSDLVYARAGNDRVNGGRGHDILYGQAGNDRISGGLGRDWLYGGPGDDTIDARDRARDVVRCGSGKDVVFARRVDRVARGCEVVRRAKRR